MARHLVPRVVLTIGCTGLGASYAVDLIGGPDVFATALNMRRGFGWIVAIGVAWAAYTGIKSGKELERQASEDAKQAARELIELIQRDRQAEEGEL